MIGYINRLSGQTHCVDKRGMSVNKRTNIGIVSDSLIAFCCAVKMILFHKGLFYERFLVFPIQFKVVLGNYLICELINLFEAHNCRGTKQKKKNLLDSLARVELGFSFSRMLSYPSKTFYNFAVCARTRTTTRTRMMMGYTRTGHVPHEKQFCFHSLQHENLCHNRPVVLFLSLSLHSL